MEHSVSGEQRSVTLESALRVVPNFPKEGIQFLDITPILSAPELFSQAIRGMAEEVKDLSFDKMVALESRGFLFASALSLELNCGFIMVRKPGKLPGSTLSQSYELEYGSDRFEIIEDSVSPGERILIVDDVLATGGSARATADLVSQAKGQVVGNLFFIELAFLKGRQLLNGETKALITKK